MLAIVSAILIRWSLICMCLDLIGGILGANKDLHLITRLCEWRIMPLTFAIHIFVFYHLIQKWIILQHASDVG